MAATVVGEQCRTTTTMMNTAALIHLAQPLVQFLRSNPYPPNLEAEKCLQDVRVVIDEILTRKRLSSSSRTIDDRDSSSKLKLQQGSGRNTIVISSSMSDMLTPTTSPGVTTSKAAVSTRAGQNNGVFNNDVNNQHFKIQQRPVEEPSNAAVGAVSAQTAKVLKKPTNIKVFPSTTLQSAENQRSYRTQAGKRDASNLRLLTRKRRKKILVAANSFENMSEEQSTANLLSYIFGHAFSNFLSGWMRQVSVLYATGILWNAAAILIFLVSHDLWESGFWVISFGSWLTCAVYIIQYLSLLNTHIFKRCLQTFDAWILLIESFLFAFSGWSLICFSASALGLAIAGFLINVPYIFFDGLGSATAKKKSKKFLLLGAINQGIVLIIFYGRMFDADRCYYRLDFSYGLVLMPHTGGISGPASNSTSSSMLISVSPAAATSSSSSALSGFATTSALPLLSRWNISLYDFCLNRGTTLFVLMLKIIYATYKHPEDCVIIKTSLRIMDATSIEVSSAPSNSALDTRRKGSTEKKA